jgi:anti-sigma regulatory factor (Ser/Thr protein kinase)
LAEGESILVAVQQHKIDLLREALEGDAAAVRFADMDEIGSNPARIIPVWQQFASRHAAAGARGIGEPISPGRGPDELTECQRHEALLNTAFDGGRGWRLACPYDTSALEPSVIEEALRSHPIVTDADGPRASSTFSELAAPFAGTLPEPRTEAIESEFGLPELPAARQLVMEMASAAGLGEERTANLVLATNEVAGNSVRHGGGEGRLRIWREDEVLFCEVADRGRIDHALAGRIVPEFGQPDGRGLWIANQLCDLVQIRSSELGTVVRLHMRLP